MTRIYEDHPELLDDDVSEDGLRRRADGIRRLIGERLEAHEREDILKLARLTGQSLDAALPLPALREAVPGLLDDVEVWRSTVIVKDEDHRRPTFECEGAGYRTFLRNAGLDVRPDDVYLLENLDYLARYEAIRNQALRVIEWAMHGGYPKGASLDGWWCGRYAIGSWTDVCDAEQYKRQPDEWCAVDTSAFVDRLNALPEDLFDLAVAALVMDGETVAAKMLASRDEARYRPYYEHGWTWRLALRFASGSGYMMRNCIRKVGNVAQSVHFTEAWAERMAASSSPFCRAGAARGAYPSVFGRLAGDDRNVRVALAGNPSAPVDVRKAFVHDDDAEVRGALALHCDMRLDCFRPLAFDDSPYVRTNVLRNHSTPDDLYAAIADGALADQSGPLIDELADNVRTSADMFRKIDLDAVVRRVDASEDSEDDDILVKLAMNPVTPPDVLGQVADTVSNMYRHGRQAVNDVAFPDDDDWEGLRDIRDYVVDVLDWIVHNPSASMGLTDRIRGLCEREGLSGLIDGLDGTE